MTSPLHASVPLPGYACRDVTGWQRQFAQPSGVLGRVAGYLMAYKNAGINQVGIDALDVLPEQFVLEVGFGPGRTLAKIAALDPTVHVFGVDRSRTMVSQAAWRNRRAIRRGRVHLLHADVAELPWESPLFDRILAVNTLQFWPHPIREARALRRLLMPGGMMVLPVRVAVTGAGPFTAPGFSLEDIDDLQDVLDVAGFDAVDRTDTQADGRDVVVLRGHVRERV